MVKGGKICLAYAEKVDMRRAEFSTPVFLPGLLGHAWYVLCVPAVGKTRLAFGIVHRIRNSFVILNPYENMKWKLLQKFVPVF